jgi:hypothetical protein
VDLALLAVLAVAVVVILTGGGIVQVGELRIRARSVENPIWILTVLISLRYALGGSWPIFGVGRWSVRGAAATGIHLVSEALPARVERLFSQPARALVAVGLGAFALKALVAWTSPGFFSGDDVEVHEMSLGGSRGFAALPVH